ncbi:MAG: tRNA (adenosine(37)-N6)-dimethylallyltransferase MiaA [Ruminococcaceae bacterium]|nr:tRNA (adenosine(37)-N6)-dimethylallyltransferase MiaA [Oscillospiraceae bacterium]
MSEKKQVLAVVGPTASGKTALSIALAKRLGGEILSCDSMQIYRRMDIGTAKPTEEEKEGIVHHLIDIADPSESFSCADYASLAVKAAEDVLSRGSVPIFCGGTGLYLDSALKPERHCEFGSDEDCRKRLHAIAEEKGNEALHDLLKQVDPASAEAIHPNNVKRVVRALEVYEVTGKSKTYWDEKSREEGLRYDARVICLAFRDRERLYRRIEQRVEMMMDAGLYEEAERLYDEKAYGETASQAIGYKELIAHFDGRCSLSEAVEAIKKNTRNYAKRQLTWFSAKKYPMLWVDECADCEEIVKKSLKLLYGDLFMV